MLGWQALRRACKLTKDLDLHRAASNAATLNHLGRYYNPSSEGDKDAFRKGLPLRQAGSREAES